MKSLNICFQASFGQTQYGWLSETSKVNIIQHVLLDRKSSLQTQNNGLQKLKKRLHSLILVSFLFNYKKEYSKHSYIFFYTFYLNEGLVLFQVEWSVYHTDVVHSQKPSLKQEAAIPMLHGLQPPIAQNKHLQ